VSCLGTRTLEAKGVVLERVGVCRRLHVCRPRLFQAEEAKWGVDLSHLEGVRVLGCLFCYMLLLLLVLVFVCMLLLLKSVEVMLLAAMLRVLMMLLARQCFVKHLALVVPIILA
jgi:hypothetical protein